MGSLLSAQSANESATNLNKDVENYLKSKEFCISVPIKLQIDEAISTGKIDNLKNIKEDILKVLSRLRNMFIKQKETNNQHTMERIRKLISNYEISLTKIQSFLVPVIETTNTESLSQQKDDRPRNSTRQIKNNNEETVYAQLLFPEKKESKSTSDDCLHYSTGQNNTKELIYANLVFTRDEITLNQESSFKDKKNTFTDKNLPVHKNPLPRPRRKEISDAKKVANFYDNLNEISKKDKITSQDIMTVVEIHSKMADINCMFKQKIDELLVMFDKQGE